MFFGEDHARISREQKRFEVIKYERSFVIKMVSAILFNLPKTHAAELDALASDEVAYAIHWQEYAVILLRGWRESSYLVRLSDSVSTHRSDRSFLSVCRFAHVGNVACMRSETS